MNLLAPEPNLIALIARPIYEALAMKCMSMRLGRDDTDLADFRFLMDCLSLREAAKVLDLVSQYYPEDRIQPKTRFAIEEICQQLSKS